MLLSDRTDIKIDRMPQTFLVKEENIQVFENIGNVLKTMKFFLTVDELALDN